MRIPENCSVVAPTSLAAFLSVAPLPSYALRVSGLPVYQWTGEASSSECFCNVPSEGWSSITPTGGGAAFAVAPVAVPQAELAAAGATVSFDFSLGEDFSSLATEPGTGAALRAHGIIMLVAWVGLLPMGAAAGRLIAVLRGGGGGGADKGCESRPVAAAMAFKCHVALQIGVVALVCASFGLVVSTLGGGAGVLPNTPSSHGAVGAAAVAALLAQFLLGMVRHCLIRAPKRAHQRDFLMYRRPNTRRRARVPATASSGARGSRRTRYWAGRRWCWEQ